MSRRIVYTTDGGDVVVRYDSEVKEYCAHIKGESSDSDYFTSDRQDAEDTADAMQAQLDKQHSHYNQNPSAAFTLDDVRRFGKMYGLEIGTHAPGDGVRRIQFIGGRGTNKRIMFTALGISQAETWLLGFMAGVDFGKSVRENPPRYNRAHPGYKGADIRFNDDFAHRGYSVKYNAIHETYYISKEGHHIGSAKTAERAREIIDELTD